MERKWPLHGNFLRFHLEERTNETQGTNLALDLGVDPSTLTRLSKGEIDVTENEIKYRNHLVPPGLTVERETLYWVNFKDSYRYLRALEAQRGLELPSNLPSLARIYLEEQKLITDQLEITAAFRDWKSRDTKRSVPHKTHKFQAESSIEILSLSGRLSMGDEPENYVEQLCELGPIRAGYVSETNVFNVVYNIAFGSTSRKFGDLIATCGLKEAKIVSEFSGLRNLTYHHTSKPLKGRLARQTGTDEFVVKETSAGTPKPFLLDSVFDDAIILSAQFDNHAKEAKINLKCLIEFSDLKVDAYATDGEQFPHLSNEQKELRKLALTLFILDRCKTGGFRGELATANWLGHGGD
jgi:hypothetical protein